MSETTQEVIDRLRRLVDDQEGGDAVVLVQRQLFNRTVGRIEAQAKRIAELEAACIPVMASLAAAISLLERGDKKAAPSDKMFDQMLADYHKSLDNARQAIS